jgi:hypothetical protein
MPLHLGAIQAGEDEFGDQPQEKQDARGQEDVRHGLNPRELSGAASPKMI